jgi:hypothetical protein
MDTHFGQCMHSRDPIRRSKVTKLGHVVLELEQLGIECDRSHDHAPWGISYPDGKPSFATSKDEFALCCYDSSSCMHSEVLWKAKFHVAAAVSATRKAARMKQQVGKQPNAAEDAFVATVQVA